MAATGPRAPGGWRATSRSSGPHEDFNGAEAFFHHGRQQNDYEYMMAAKYLSAGDKPAVVFMHYMNGSWHYRLIDPKEVQLGIAQTVAGGANPWLALIRSALSPTRGAGTAGAVRLPGGQQGLLHRHGERRRGGGALLQPHRPALPLDARDLRAPEHVGQAGRAVGENDPGGAGVAQRQEEKQAEDQLTSSSEGYFHALTRAHVLFDIILDQDLTPEKLARYKVLVLADAACLTPEAAAAVRDFVHKGGNLLASYEAGLYGDKGEASTAMFELLGIREVAGTFRFIVENYVQAVSEYWGIAKGRLLERASQALKVKAADGIETPSRFLEPLDRPYVPVKGLSEFPALLTHRYGQGEVVYFPEAMGAFIGESKMSSAEMRIVRRWGSFWPNPS